MNLASPVPPQTRRGSSLWSIGIFEGESPLALASPPGLVNPVLTRHSVKDVEAAFVADPFMLRVGALWHLFCEVKNARTRHGEIGLATSTDGHCWEYQGTVLREPFHLSYPCVFRWQNGYYMTLETLSESAVWLYEATSFPEGWRRVAKMIPGVYADPTIFEWNDLWWLFACGAPWRHDTLSLFYAESPFGPWREHPQNPIVRENPGGARPGGRITIWEGKPIRFAQDCVPAYGTRVRAFEIVDLTPHSYCEREVPQSPILSPGETWNRTGMHHVDPHMTSAARWIACVDGYLREPAD
jgi:hypothetical protein